MCDIYFLYLFPFFNLFWMMISRKLANLFEKFWLSWHLSMFMFRFYPSVFGLLIAIDAWFEMIYVKYKNIFFRITYQFTLWGVFCACSTHPLETHFVIHCNLGVVFKAVTFSLIRVCGDYRISFASFLVSPVSQGENRGFFSKNDCLTRKNAEIIWRTRKKISNSPSKIVENCKCSWQNSGCKLHVWVLLLVNSHISFTAYGINSNNTREVPLGTSFLRPRRKQQIDRTCFWQATYANLL